MAVSQHQCKVCQCKVCGKWTEAPFARMLESVLHVRVLECYVSKVENMETAKQRNRPLLTFVVLVDDVCHHYFLKFNSISSRTSKVWPLYNLEWGCGSKNHLMILNGKRTHCSTLILLLFHRNIFSGFETTLQVWPCHLRTCSFCVETVCLTHYISG